MLGVPLAWSYASVTGPWLRTMPRTATRARPVMRETAVPAATVTFERSRLLTAMLMPALRPQDAGC